MIPAEEHPEINFVGLILGPRGNSLEAIKKKHGTMVAIRGKGSLKDGMSGITKDGKIVEHLDEPMHAYITGPTAEAVKGCADDITELIEMQIYRPDCEKVNVAPFSTACYCEILQVGVYFRLWQSARNTCTSWRS